MRSENAIRDLYKIIMDRFIKDGYNANEFMQGELNAFEIVLEIPMQYSYIARKKVK
jgi:hypothetical protein